jgi:tetratricopeptide (TPR) repeat protein
LTALSLASAPEARPKKSKMLIMRICRSLLTLSLLFAAALAVATYASAQPPASTPSTPSGEPQWKPDATAPPPRSDESSSKDTKVDLSPPMGDEASHPNSGIADDVLELRSWNPLKAMKNIEVGDYYLKQKNYAAAESRYREALSWKANDAEATFKLATTLEKTKQQEEARTQYESYLKVLPKGPYAEECKKALAHLPKPAKPIAAKTTAEN